MPLETPDLVIYDAAGNPLAVQNATVIPGSTPTIIMGGSDGTNSRYITVDTSGRQVVVSTSTDNTTNSTAKLPVIAAVATTVAPTYTTGNMVPLSVDTSGNLRITGSISAANPSVSATGATPPASATYAGASVTTSAPSYTTGQMSALSLTTSGFLRVDGSGTTQPVSGTITVNIGTTNGLALDATLTAQSIIDNSGFTDGTTRIVPSGYIFDEVSGISLTENDAAAGRIDSKRAQIHVIEDGTARGTRATIKAASTAAVATDTALVVAISPNNSLTIASAGDTTSTGALGALNAAVQVNTAGLNTVGFQLAAGTLIGTLVAEVSFDGGTIWNATYFDTQSNGKVLTIVFASSNTATAATIIGEGGSGLTRVRVSAYTSGTANITLRATTRSDPSVLFAATPAGSPPPVAAQIAGTDGTLLRAILTDTSGRLIQNSQVDQLVLNNGATFGSANGFVTTNAIINTNVSFTTLSNPASAATRSVVSTSAGDNPVGGGAFTVKITYYDLNGAGPFTETVTLNGTTAVNTVSSSIYFIESFVVATSSTVNGNLGTISLFAAVAGGGAALVSLSSTASDTSRGYWARHFVATGKTCYIKHLYTISTGIAGTLVIQKQGISAGVLATPTVTLMKVRSSLNSQLDMHFDIPLTVTGPAQILMTILPDTTAVSTTYAGFSFIDI